jgi:phosphoglucosamine mutase
MSRKYFGTDGIRGPVGEFPITPDFVMKLGWAAGKVFLERQGDRRPLILIGKDTRSSGYMFESALESGLIAAGVNVGLLGPMPTPAIAYLTETFNAMAGIVISASHNPHYDNGIKFFSSNGQKLPDDVEMAIEAMIDQEMTVVDAADLGHASHVTDAGGRYVEFCKFTAPRNFSLQGMKLVVDCAHGATYQVAPKVFKELGAKVISIGASPDGRNINDHVGSTHPEALVEAVRENEADLGIALDGDGDRLLLVDHLGRIIDGDDILYVMAKHRHEAHDDCRGVVGTLMSNMGLEIAIRQMGMGFVRTKVGDRYVVEAMKKHNWPIGGESSGHIICSDVQTTGDGIVAALQVLVAIRSLGVDLATALEGMHRYPQKMINVKVADKNALSGCREIWTEVQRIEEALGDSGRVLLRPSGTENLIRVMVEAKSDDLVEQYVNPLAELVVKALS